VYQWICVFCNNSSTPAQLRSHILRVTSLWSSRSEIMLETKLSKMYSISTP
jgi:hypothetical protein